MTPAGTESVPSLSASGPVPTVAQLRVLVDAGKHREAAALLDGVDLAAETAADFLYYAAVCLGSLGQKDIAVDLLKRAAESGFPPFWCAYHLGLFEMHRRRPAAAACYLTGALVLNPERSDIDGLLDQVAPGIDRRLLHAAQSGTRPATAEAAASRSAAELATGNVGAAAHYLTIALFLDPDDRRARDRLLDLIPDLATTVLSSPQAPTTVEKPPGRRQLLEAPPTARRLRELVDNAQFADAIASLEGVDLAKLDAEAKYLAAICFGSADGADVAVELLTCAASEGFAAFWCAYHLGLFETKRARKAEAAFYLTASAILAPERPELLPLLSSVAPDIDLTSLQAAQAGTRSQSTARAAFAAGLLALEAGNPGSAGFYFATALALDPQYEGARARLQELAPALHLAVLPSLANPPEPEPAGDFRSLRPGMGKMPSARQLEVLVNSGKYREAAALLDGVRDADLPVPVQYFAGICFGATGQEQRAIDLLKRAVANGFPRFWCAFNLGLFEEHLGNAVAAAYYYTAAAILDPARADIRGNLARIAPDADFTLLRQAQARTPSAEAACEAVRRGIEKQQAGGVPAAASCFAAALALDPRNQRARSRLVELAPDLSVDIVTGIDVERLVADLADELEQTDAEDDLERKLKVAEKINVIFPLCWHESGRAMVPALERLFHLALATPEISLDRLCMLFDTIGFLYFYMSPHASEMRGFAKQLVEPFAAAIRRGVGGDRLPPIVRRPLGREPLRLGYLSEFANSNPANAIGPYIDHTLGGLARHFPGKYKSFLYAWRNHDDDFFSLIEDGDIASRRFEDYESMTEWIAAVAKAIADDEVDILITDMNEPLATVLFERRVAPVQIHYNAGGLPFWPLQNIDAVFRVDVYDPELDGFDLAKCFPVGLGPWDLPRLAPKVDRARIAAERARFPADARLIGNYGRLAKLAPGFMSMVAELVVRHPDVTVVLGGEGNCGWIREFIAARGLTGRIDIIERTVDGHVWGHMLDFFLDTFPTEGGVSRREVMAKGRPVVTMLGAWAQYEAVPTLVARDPGGYLEIVSRLLTDREFYEKACAATREFVASGMSKADYAAVIDDALTTIARRVRAAS